MSRLHTTTHTFTKYIIALTLIAAAVGVFAQENDTEILPIAEEAVLEVEATPAAESTEFEASETPTVVKSVPTTITSGGVTVPTDTYSREVLSSTEVYSDFVVGPGRFEVQLAPGQSRTVELIVTNRMGEGKIFSLDTEDVEGSKTTDGGIELLGGVTGPYTIKDFIKVPYPQFYLEHDTRVRIPVTISLPPDAEPGGRYGSLLVSIVSRPVDEGDRDDARPATVIISRIGTLFFVTTPGDIERESELIEFSTRNQQRFFSTGPITLDLVTENTGSVHTNPYGTLTIMNLLGEEVGMVELDRWFVMPQSLRTRSVEWDREALIGRYKAKVEINRGYGDIVDTKSYVFWVIPLKLVAIVFASLFVFFLVLRFLFSRFEFKRKN